MSRKEPKEYLKIMQDIAEKNGGKLISTEWKGVSYKYKFSFHNGIIFEKLYRNLIRGWPKSELVIKRRKKMTSNEKLQEIATILQKSGHKLMSTEWVGKDNGLDVKLSNGENIYITPRKILKGYFYSRKDKGLITEPIFKQAFEYLFGYPFIKTNKILIIKENNNKKYLELDGYCDELKIAFEYQGHSAHWNVKNFRYESTYKRDILKNELCSKLGIVLIQIPMIKESEDKWNSKKIIENLIPLIQKKFIEEKRKIPEFSISDFKINFDVINHSRDMLNRLEDLAKKNKAELLSTEWKGSKVKYLFKYQDGTIFEAVPKILFKKGWPSNINKFIRYSKGHSKSKEELLRDLDRNGEKYKLKLISKEWNGMKGIYKFENDKGEIIEKTAETLSRKSRAIKKAQFE